MNNIHLSSLQGRSKLPVLLLLIAVGIAAWGIASRLNARTNLREQAAGAAVVHVQTIKPQRGGEAVPLVLPATVEPWAEAAILARTNGYLKRWYVDIGSVVKAGQLLAEIETPEVDAQLQQAQADNATAKANLALASSTALRYHDLIREGLVSQQDADTKFAAETVAKAAVLSAEANVSRLRQLSAFKRVVAPFEGVVTARNTDIGALIGAGTGEALFRVADISRLRLYVQVPQAYAASVQPGLEASFSMADHPGQTYKALVTSTANTLNATNRSLLTQLTVDNPDRALLAGGYAEVQLTPAASEGALAPLRLPANALLFRAEGLQVVTVEPDGLARLKSIRIARDLGAMVEVAEGLSANDDVVLNPPDSIADGMALQIKPSLAEATKS